MLTKFETDGHGIIILIKLLFVVVFFKINQ